MIESVTYDMIQVRRYFVHYCNEYLEEIGISRGMLFFILYIGKNPGCTPTEVSDALKFDGGQTARSLKKLEQIGFIKRSRRLEDKRVYVLNLTEKGKQAFAMSHRVFHTWDQMILEPLSPEERLQVGKLLKKMKSAMGKREKWCICEKKEEEK